MRLKIIKIRLNLGGTVDGIERTRNGAIKGADVDDGAFFSLYHRGQNDLGELHQGSVVYFDQRVYLHNAVVKYGTKS